MTPMRALLTLSVLAAAALAAPAAAAPPEGIRLTVKAGETVSICTTGTIQCPAGALRCEDPEIAVPADTKDGAGFKGLKPGSTICSAGAAGGAGTRVVYRVVVGLPGSN